MLTDTIINHDENYYVEAATARGLSFLSFVRASMDEYIKQHPPVEAVGENGSLNDRQARISFEDAMSLCGINKSDLDGFEEVELE